MMGQEETIRLLQECDAGVQMGIASIQEVLPYVKERKIPAAVTWNAGINMKNCRRRSGGNWKPTGMRGKNRT